MQVTSRNITDALLPPRSVAALRRLRLRFTHGSLRALNIDYARPSRSIFRGQQAQCGITIGDRRGESPNVTQSIDKRLMELSKESGRYVLACNGPERCLISYAEENVHEEYGCQGRYARLECVDCARARAYAQARACLAHDRLRCR